MAAQGWFFLFYILHVIVAYFDKCSIAEHSLSRFTEEGTNELKSGQVLVVLLRFCHFNIDGLDLFSQLCPMVDENY